MNEFSNELKMKNFKYKDGNYFIKKTSGKPGLVLVYASWCGYSKILGPEWREFERENSKYYIASIKVDKEKSGNDLIADQLDISGYPTIKYINKDGKIGETYEGERNIENFLKYLSKK